jgi:hypothetical protein
LGHIVKEAMNVVVGVGRVCDEDIIGRHLLQSLHLIEVFFSRESDDDQKWREVSPIVNCLKTLERRDRERERQRGRSQRRYDDVREERL